MAKKAKNMEDYYLADFEASEIDHDVGRRLKDLRQRADKTQSDIATVLDISPQQYQKYETGASRCSIATLFRLAAYYQKPVGELLPPTGQTTQGFSEDGSSFSNSAPAVALTDEAEAMAQVLSVFIRIPSKSLRQKIIGLLNDMFDNPTSPKTDGDGTE